MHLLKYDFDYGRRALMKKAAAGIAHSGVLTALWPMLSKADTLDISKAYPDELISIEMQTHGKVSPGDLVTADNVEHVEHLLDPITLHQIKNDGRRIRIVEPVTDVSRLFQQNWLEATLQNLGKAKLDTNGNVWMNDGRPWLGGTPFPDPKTAHEALMNIHLTWGRRNYVQYPIENWNLGPDGDIDYRYDLMWVELNVASRPDNSIWRNQSELLRYNTVMFTHPNEQAGTSFLSTWYYDQRKYPELIGYIPAFKRVREYPTNQRFEPLVPGVAFYLSDAYWAGDPMLTWGNFKVVERKPMLGPANNWRGSSPNWRREDTRHGGPKGKTYWEINYWMVPEAIVTEMEPTGYPRSPVGKKRFWQDARNLMGVAYNTYDRKGDLWKNVEASFTLFEDVEDPNHVYKDPLTGNTAWMWQYVQAYDIQARRMTQLNHSKEIAGGYQTDIANEDRNYDRFLTRQALLRLGV